VVGFFRALGPATVGSMGTQIALFADTIIATFLASGALSALYYADRLNQLPIGVIGIAIGTVLLPDMSRRISANDHAGAMAAQRRAFDFTLLFSVPFVAAFLTVPDVIMRAMFARGAFTKADAAAAGATLAAYAVGLIPFVLIRSAVATFYARKDTATPVKSALTGIAVNLALKLALARVVRETGREQRDRLRHEQPRHHQQHELARKQQREDAVGEQPRRHATALVLHMSIGGNEGGVERALRENRPEVIRQPQRDEESIRQRPSAENRGQHDVAREPSQARQQRITANGEDPAEHPPASSALAAAAKWLCQPATASRTAEMMRSCVAVSR
jgi:hypothetical protein